MPDPAALHPGLQEIADITATIDSVSIAVDETAKTATMTVNFTVKDAEGAYIPGLGAISTSDPTRLAYLRFALSQLQPAATPSGDPATCDTFKAGQL